MNWCRGCRQEIVHPDGYCHVEKEAILLCGCGNRKTITGTGAGHAHVCLKCRRQCWACGHEVSAAASGVLCGRCRAEHTRNGCVEYRRLPRPSPNGPKCIDCGALLNPETTTDTCIFCAEALPAFLTEIRPT